ncbi:MAG TPA: hypothetical protein VGC00_06195 [Thermoanaerobaculia bacterium]|jgi:hypothetical protein
MTETASIRSTSDGETAVRRQPGLVWVALLAASVVAFRVGAYLAPSRFVAVPEQLALPLGGLGLLFLGCGLFAWWARPSGATRLFLFYGAGMGVHWGTPIGFASPELETVVLVLYAAATLGSDGALLDLALRFPGREGRAARVVSAVYLLALGLAIAAIVTPFLPRQPLAVALGIAFGASFLASIAAGIVFATKWFRAARRERRALGLTPVVAALAVASSLYLLGDAGVLPGPAQAWGLPFALVPLALARALTRARS